MSSTARFADAARLLGQAARRNGLAAPSFRSPPKLVGVDRTIRRRGEQTVVSVRVRERPWPAVLADMIEGVVAANRLVSPQADRVRGLLWEALEPGPAATADRRVA
ncbi:MAG: hypothetical protein ACO3D0_11155 [Ilumatobacteraceae bacterium]